MALGQVPKGEGTWTGVMGGVGGPQCGPRSLAQGGDAAHRGSPWGLSGGAGVWARALLPLRRGAATPVPVTPTAGAPPKALGARGLQHGPLGPAGRAEELLQQWGPTALCPTGEALFADRNQHHRGPGLAQVRLFPARTQL